MGVSRRRVQALGWGRWEEGSVGRGCRQSGGCSKWKGDGAVEGGWGSRRREGGAVGVERVSERKVV